MPWIKIEEGCDMPSKNMRVVVSVYMGDGKYDTISNCEWYDYGGKTGYMWTRFCGVMGGGHRISDVEVVGWYSEPYYVMPVPSWHPDFDKEKEEARKRWEREWVN